MHKTTLSRRGPAMRSRLALLFFLLPCAVLASTWETEIRAAAGMTALGKFGPAELHLRAALNSAGDDSQRATAWNNLAVVLVDQGRYGEAETAFRVSLRLWKRYGGEDCPNKANPLNSLGGLLVDLGRIREAERHVSRSLELRRANPGDFGLAPALNNLALVRLAQRRYREAEAALHESLAECGKAGKDCAATIMSVYHNLALALEGLGRRDESIAAFLKAIAAGETHWGAAHPRLGWTYLELALAHIKSGNDSFASPLFEKLLAMSESHNLVAHPLITQAMEAYGKLLVRQHRDSEGKALMRQARAAREALEADARRSTQVVDIDSLRR